MLKGRIGRVAAIGAALWVAVLPALGDPTRVLLGPGLEATAGEVLDINAQGVVFRDDIGRTRTLGWSRVVALTTPAARAGTPPLQVAIAPGLREPVALVETIDGQRLIGTLIPAEGEGGGGAVSVDLGSLGVATVGLDRVSRVVLGAGRVLQGEMPGGPGAGATADDDVLVLVNGDRLSGFLLGVGERIEIDAGGGEVGVPLDRVAGFRLANPPEPASGPRVWLRGGMVLGVEPWAVTTGPLAIETRRATSIDPDDVVAFAPEAGAIAGLASHGVASYTPAPSRRWTVPPEPAPVARAPLGAADVRLPGPMAVDWTLDPLDARLSMTVGLVRGFGDRPGPWADCTVRVEVVARGGRVESLSEHRLGVDSPEAGVNVALPGVGETGRLLRVVVDEGAYGPVQDEVVLGSPLLLREEAPRR